MYYIYISEGFYYIFRISVRSEWLIYAEPEFKQKFWYHRVYKMFVYFAFGAPTDCNTINKSRKIKYKEYFTPLNFYKINILKPTGYVMHQQV